jgi:hypothetical protein
VKKHGILNAFLRGAAGLAPESGLKLPTICGDKDIILIFINKEVIRIECFVGPF